MRAKVSLQQKPKLMRDINNQLNQYKKASIKELQSVAAELLQSQGMKTRTTPKYVVATEAKLMKRGIIDLKPRYARSPNRKRKEGGGWYVKVPIHIKARSFNKTTVYKRALSQFKELEKGASKTVTVKGLFEGKTQSTLSSLQYKPKSERVTGIKNETGKRTTYIAFRTVSDKSAPSSWIIGRRNAREDNTSKTFKRDIDRLMKWKFKQMTGG